MTGVLAIVALGLIVLIGRDVFLPPPVRVTAVSTANVTRGTVRQAVSGTGTVVPAGQLNVNFRASGLLTEVDARVGDHVKTGQLLARIDSTAAQNALATASANLASAYANYQNSITPATAAQIAQLQHNIAASQASYNQTVASVNLTNQQDAAQVPVDQQQMQADQAQQNSDQAQLSSDQNQVSSDQNTVNADQIALNNNGQYQSDLYNLQTFQSNHATDTARFQQDGCGSQTYPYQGQCSSDFAAVSNDQRNVNTYQARVNTDMTQLTADQNKLAADQQKVNADQQKANADQQKVNADQQKVNADQAKIAQDQLAGQRSIASAQTAIQSAQDALAVQTTTKGSAADAAAASVQAARAQVDSAQLILSQTVLYAPAGGTVISINGAPGEAVGAGTGTTLQAPGSSAPQPSATGTTVPTTSFMTIASQGGLQVVVPFAEFDAARVAANQTGTISFDAVPSLSLPGHVLSVATSSTIVSNVVNYYATLTLDRSDPRIKQGMTANVSLIVAQASNVLVVPTRAVTRVGPLAFVTILTPAGRQVRTPVQLGAVGDSTIEVKSGLSGGDRIVIPSLRAPSGNTPIGRGILGGGGRGG